MKPAFSTVACPDWTFSKLFDCIESFGFLGVELRTFGGGSTQVACDPALTSSEKLRANFARSGVSVCGLATGIRYDAIVSPPVIGSVIRDQQRSVRETRGAVELAVQLECPLVRVFAFELPEGEPMKRGAARIAERLTLASEYCRTSGVRLVVENGGSFPRAVDLANLLDKVGSPLVGASYSLAVAMAAGEKPADGINVLGERLLVAKVKDMRGGKPVALGEGELDARVGVDCLARAAFDGWLVYEFDRAWLGADSVEVAGVLTRSAKTMFSWVGTRRSAGRALGAGA
jgi:sugar phosphate isomerase/epimerase